MLRISISQILTLYRVDESTISVPTRDVLIRQLKIGDIVSFSYERHARRYGPVNPQVYRVRTDISWQEAVLQAKKDAKYLNGKRPRIFKLHQAYIIRTFAR